MGSEDRDTAKKRAYGAGAAALGGWLLHTAIQRITVIAVVGVFIDLLNIFFVYLLMPFAFSALLLELIKYASDRLRGRCDRDIEVAVLLAAALALAFIVTGPVIGKAAIIKVTAAFLVFRLLLQYR